MLVHYLLCTYLANPVTYAKIIFDKRLQSFIAG